MKSFKQGKTVRFAILCFVCVFALTNIFSINYAQQDDIFFSNDQTINGPGFFPFSNSQGVVDIFNQQGCQDVTFTIFGNPSLSGSTLEVGPAANGAETGNRDILIFGPDGRIIFNDPNFPLADPFSMNTFDPSMGDILGLSFVPGSAFPGSAVVMIDAVINCDGSSTTTSSSTSSSSGSVVGSSSGRSGLAIVSSAINLEKNAKDFIDLKDLLMGDSSFSVSMALDALMSSLSDLQELKNNLQGSDIMLGMASAESKADDAISKDSEAQMLLDPFKDKDPSLTDEEFTQAVTKAKKLISEALRLKERIEKKLKKEK